MTASCRPACFLLLIALPAAGCASRGPAPATVGDLSTPIATPPSQQAAPEAGAQPAPTTTEAQPDSDSSASPAAGIFSATQAERGAATFDEVCSQCHTTSEFRGASFQRNWGRRTVYSFFRTVRSTMPDDNPGGLDEQTYLDVTTYIMRMNGHEAGPSEMLPDSPMRQVRMDPTWLPNRGRIR